MFASPLAAEPSATEGVAMDVAGVVVAADSVLARAMSGAGVGALLAPLSISSRSALGGRSGPGLVPLEETAPCLLVCCVDFAGWQMLAVAPASLAPLKRRSPSSATASRCRICAVKPEACGIASDSGVYASCIPHRRVLRACARKDNARMH